MNKSWVIPFLGVFCLFFSLSVSALEYNSTNTNITDCGKITENGTYQIANDLLANEVNCLEIGSNDVVVNGNDKIIVLVPIVSDQYYGVGAEGIYNLSINNLQIYSFGIAGLIFKNSVDISITNMTLQSNYYGLYVVNSSGVNIFSSDISSNTNKDNITKYYLDISSVPSSINITIEGTENKAGSEGRYELEEGNYTVYASKEGYYSANQTIIITGNNETSFNLAQIPAPVATSSGGGAVKQNHCGDWGACESGFQLRTCTNGDQSRICTVIENETTPEPVILNQPLNSEQNEEAPQTGFLTGAVIGNLSGGSLLVIGAVVIIVVGGLCFVVYKRKKAKRSVVPETGKKKKK